MDNSGHKPRGRGAEAPTGGGVFDYERSLARLGGDPALFSEIVVLFLEDSPTLAQQARGGLESRDFPELERAAHSLKGLSVNFDARALAAAALSVEQHARDGDLERATARFSDLECELERLQAVLRKFLETRGSGRPPSGSAPRGATPPQT